MPYNLHCKYMSTIIDLKRLNVIVKWKITSSHLCIIFLHIRMLCACVFLWGDSLYHFPMKCNSLRYVNVQNVFFFLFHSKFECIENNSIQLDCWCQTISSMAFHIYGIFGKYFIDTYDLAQIHCNMDYSQINNNRSQCVYVSLSPFLFIVQPTILSLCIECDIEKIQIIKVNGINNLRVLLVWFKCCIRKVIWLSLKSG